MNYKQAFDKITEAYIRGEIQPFSPEFCFCGTLCGGREWYRGVRFPLVVNQFPHSGYSGLELGTMEKALLDEVWDVLERSEQYEEKLFSGMSAALDVLKQIHIERGEIIDEVPEFTKRALTSTPLK